MKLIVVNKILLLIKKSYHLHRVIHLIYIYELNINHPGKQKFLAFFTLIEHSHLGSNNLFHGNAETHDRGQNVAK